MNTTSRIHVPIKATFNGMRRVKKAERNAELFYRRLHQNFERAYGKQHESDVKQLENKLAEYQLSRLVSNLSIREDQNTPSRSRTRPRKRNRRRRRGRKKRAVSTSSSGNDESDSETLNNHRSLLEITGLSWMEKIDDLLKSSSMLISGDAGDLESAQGNDSDPENTLGDISSDENGQRSKSATSRHIGLSQKCTAAVPNEPRPRRPASVPVGQKSRLGLTHLSDGVHVQEYWLGDPAAISSVRRPLLSKNQKLLNRMLTQSARQASAVRPIKENDEDNSRQGYIPPYPVYFQSQKKPKKPSRGKPRSQQGQSGDRHNNLRTGSPTPTTTTRSERTTNDDVSPAVRPKSAPVPLRYQQKTIFVGTTADVPSYPKKTCDTKGLAPKRTQSAGIKHRSTTHKSQSSRTNSEASHAKDDGGSIGLFQRIPSKPFGAGRHTEARSRRVRSRHSASSLTERQIQEAGKFVVCDSRDTPHNTERMRDLKQRCGRFRQNRTDKSLQQRMAEYMHIARTVLFPDCEQSTSFTPLLDFKMKPHD